MRDQMHGNSARTGFIRAVGENEQDVLHPGLLREGHTGRISRKGGQDSSRGRGGSEAFSKRGGKGRAEKAEQHGPSNRG